MRSALLAQRISAAAASLQSTTVALPGSNNQTASAVRSKRRRNMDSVLRDWPRETLHLSFHSAEFDLFIQARQNELLLIECPLAETRYKFLCRSHKPAILP